VVNSWPGGFQGQVTVTNPGTRPLTGWSVSWTSPAGLTVGQVWNGSRTQSGQAVTVTDAGWNGALAAGAATSFGFLAAATGDRPATPDLTCRAVAAGA
jgi:hypothetical protein